MNEVTKMDPRATLQNILRRSPSASDFAGKNVRNESEVKHLAAVSKALEDVPRLVAQSHDTLAQQFIDVAETAAKALEELGDASLQDGQRRHEEYYRLAQVTRQKGAYQAKEAVGYIDGIATIRGVASNAKLPAIQIPPEDELLPSQDTE